MSFRQRYSRLTRSYPRSMFAKEDSEEMIKAVLSPATTSSRVKGLKALNEIGSNNRILLAWMPRHKGVAGNEEAS